MHRMLQLPMPKLRSLKTQPGSNTIVVSGNGGEYSRPALKPGVYSVEVEAAGFKRATQRNVILTAGDRVGVNIQLTLGEITQSVEVSAQAPLLQTETTILGAAINAQQMSELPLGGQRTFTYLARLSPGVVPAEPGARDAVGGGFSANGVRSNGQNNFLLNGVDNNVNVIDFLNQTSYVVGPSVEAIGEMRVMTNGYNAEYGRGAGGVVNVTLKSGTNGLHGSLFEYFQNAAMNSNRWENNRNGQQQRRVRTKPIRRRGRRTRDQEQDLLVCRLSGNATELDRRRRAEPGHIRIFHDSDPGNGERRLLSLC